MSRALWSNWNNLLQIEVRIILIENLESENFYMKIPWRETHGTPILMDYYGNLIDKEMGRWDFGWHVIQA